MDQIGWVRARGSEITVVVVASAIVGAATWIAFPEGLMDRYDALPTDWFESNMGEMVEDPSDE